MATPPRSARADGTRSEPNHAPGNEMDKLLACSPARTAGTGVSEQHCFYLTCCLSSLCYICLSIDFLRTNKLSTEFCILNFVKQRNKSFIVL